MCEDDATVIIETQEDFTTVIIDNDCEEVTIICSGLGQAGLSAYEIAIANGFVGTQQQWLNSLKGIANLVTSGFGEDKEYNSATGTLTIDKYNWMDLARGFKTKPTLFATTATGKVYRYVYETQTLYRFVATDLTLDAFYSDSALLNKLCEKKINF
jgi:hypothetical protein